MKRLLLMCAILTAVLVGCEKTEKEQTELPDIVPSTPEELLNFCKGKWQVTYEYTTQDDYFEGEFAPGFVIDDEGLHEALVNEERTAMYLTGETQKIISNDGKTIVFDEVNMGVGVSFQHCTYVAKDRMLRVFPNDNIGTGVYATDSCMRVTIPIREFN